MDFDTIQRVAHAYLLELPLEKRVITLRDVLGVDISVLTDGTYTRSNNIKSHNDMDEYTRVYINWMRVDESQKIFDFIQK